MISMMIHINYDNENNRNNDDDDNNENDDDDDSKTNDNNSSISNNNDHNNMTRWPCSPGRCRARGTAGTFTAAGCWDSWME